MEIQMVDLRGQYEKIKEEVNAAILQVIEKSAFINGPDVKELAKDLAAYNGVKHVIPCANGTDALQIAMMGLGLLPGDEVIVPAFTYVATAEVIALLGLKPVFIDVVSGTFELDVDQLTKKISPRTSAIVPVHLYGQCSDMETILKFAAENNIKVIEDTAQAIGADYTFSEGKIKKAGTMGDIGTTSFFPSKNLGCYGDGGAIFTNNDVMAEKLQMIANHGQKKKYHHESIGVNSRLDTIQAAILRIKLRYLDDYCDLRNQVAGAYDEAFRNIPNLLVPVRAAYSSHVFHQYTLTVENDSRDDLKHYLAEKGIPSMIYYPVPLHMQKAYMNFGFREGDFHVSEELFKKVISLPIHTEMSAEQLDHIISSVKTFFA